MPSPMPSVRRSFRDSDAASCFLESRQLSDFTLPARTTDADDWVLDLEFLGFTAKCTRCTSAASIGQEPSLRDPFREMPVHPLLVQSSNNVVVRDCGKLPTPSVPRAGKPDT
jgi:hypothetical protein